MKFAFTKMHACGNDFVILDDRAGVFSGKESALAQRLCCRRTALGADGLLLLRGGVEAGRFEMMFVNADGLIGETCGNGARCLAAYIKRAGLAGDSLQIDTLAGAIAVSFFDDGIIVLDLPPAGLPVLDRVFDWKGRTWRFDTIDVGVPHAVCFIADRDSLAAIDVQSVGCYVRHHSIFAPRGINVNFVSISTEGLHLRTYERGVEAETLSCGTGATAAALLAHERFGLPSPVTVWTSSGESLTIRFDMTQNMLKLSGAAHFVADGTLAPGILDDLADVSA